MFRSFRRLRVPFTSIALVIVGCAPDPPGPTVPISAAPKVADRTIWEGVYTEEQGRRGRGVYASSCARCHGVDLAGDEAVPELLGVEFLERWSRKRAGNLFAFMKSEMPPELEDRLTPPEYADVLAFLLSRNDAPAGEEELAGDFATLQGIRMARTD